MLEMCLHLPRTQDLGLLDMFRHHRDADLRVAVARNEHATPAMLLELASDPDEMVRRAVAANPSCPPEGIELLLMDPIPRVTRELSKNPNLPAEKMREWAGQWITADEGLASNRSCPEDVMLKLAKLGDYEVCVNLAANPQTSARVLQMLAESEHEAVRGTTALNKLTPLPVLLKLLRDDDIDVHCAALRHWLCPASFLVEAFKTKHFEIWESVAGNPRTPGKILTGIANYEYTPDEYSQDWDPEAGDPGMLFKDVLTTLASNPMVPGAVLSRLCAHEDEDVAALAQKNPGRTFTDEPVDQTISVQWDRDLGKAVIYQPY